MTTVATTPETTNAAPPAPTALAKPTAPLPELDDTNRAIGAFSSASNFVVAQKMARALSLGSLVPKEYSGGTDGAIANVMIAMELASRINASVFAVMQNIDIIHGRPSWRAQFLIATVNACGRFTPLRYRFEGTVNTATWGCRAVAKDRETGEELVGALITLAMAKAEGWSTKAGSKWLTMPEQMLMYRSAAFWQRAYAPELSLGMTTAEEASDFSGSGNDIQVTAIPAPIAAKTLQDALLGAPAGQPVTVDVPASPPSEPKPATPEPAAEAKPSVDPPTPPTPTITTAPEPKPIPETNLFEPKPAEAKESKKSAAKKDAEPPPERQPGEEG